MIIRMTLTNRAVYTLNSNGAVLARSDGPKGWEYGGNWIILGFKRRIHSAYTVSLAEALGGADVGQGWVVDLDHGTRRLWAHPTGRRLASLHVEEV